MTTLKRFLIDSNVNDTLIRAVVRQCGGWSNFKDIAQDVTNHGAMSGFSGFTYYVDTIAFFKKNKKAIMELVNEQAKDFGVCAFQMIADFKCLKVDVGSVAEAIHNPHTEDIDSVRNALAWYALEEVSRSYVDCVEIATDDDTRSYGPHRGSK